MRVFQLKRSRNLANRSRFYPLYALAALSLTLAIALGVVGVLKARDSRVLSANREQLRSGIESDLTMVLRTYEQVSLPRADVAGELLPTMRMHLYSAYSLNNILTDTYGANSSVLDYELYNQLNAAMDEVDRQINAGQIVDYKSATLTSYIGEMQGVMAQAFGTGGLMPQTARQ